MIYKKLTDIQQHIGKMSEYKSITKNFHQMPELAFDYIVEKLKEVFVISSDLGWDDVGSWQVIQEIVSHINKTNNVTRGNHISIDDSGSLIYAQKKLIATIGLKDIIVVDTKDATLICDKHHSQDVKKIVEILEKNKKFNRYL
jgi:mannose-1-phosphate guanylyltransferase